ncbi:MAG: tandem-95 repeat protein, partial [Pirellulales bacterium]|nr:tandem-95 repeat protein [Pirellulales bacterium]
DPGGPAVNATFTLSLTNPADFAITANVMLGPGTALYTNDYSGPTTINVTIPSGQTSAQILVPITADLVVEPQEEFYATIASANVTTTDWQGTSAIIDNDYAPVAVDDGYSIDRLVDDDCVPLPFYGSTVLVNDYDPGSAALSASLVGGPSVGTLAFNADGTFAYTPPDSFSGTTSFTYRAFNGATYSNVAVVTLVVTNVAPLANNDAYAIHKNSTLSVEPAGVLENDSDTNGDPLTATLVTSASNGSLTLNSDGSFTYAPNLNFVGTDSFTYRASDCVDQSNLATVTISVLNNTPYASGDHFSTRQNTVLTVDPKGVLENDWDPDNDALSAVLNSGPLHGSLLLNGNGSFTYTPQNGFSGTETFTYRASDGSASSDLATVYIDVAPIGVPEVTEVILSRDVFAQDDGGEGTVSAIVYNGSSAPINYGDYTLTLSVQGAGSSIVIPNASFAVPALAPGQQAVVPVSGTSIIVSSGAMAGSYPVVAQVGGSSKSKNLYVGAVTGYKVELQQLDGAWMQVRDGEPLWSHDNLRWTPEFGPKNPPGVQQVSWYAKPWADRNNAAVPWVNFASVVTSTGLDPAYGTPGTGSWAIRPQVRYVNDVIAKLRVPKQQIVAQIDRIEWQGIDPGDGSTNLTADNPLDLGGGLRLFPDQNSLQANAPDHRQVNVVVFVSPAELSIPVRLKLLDADDPTDFDGPIDNDPNPVDNKGRAGPAPDTLTTSQIVGQFATATGVFSVSLQPGNNFRFAAAPRASDFTYATAKVLPISSATAPETLGRLYRDRNNNRRFDGGDVTIDETQPAPPIVQPAKGTLGPVVATPLLTIWRRLNVEADSMGAPPNGTQFEDDDPNPGDIPQPDISALAAAFRPAFIEPRLLTGNDPNGVPFTQGDIPFATGFANDAAIAAFFAPFRQSVSRPLFWSSYIVNVYQVDPVANDNDPDQESGILGLTTGSPQASIIATETIRDVGAQQGWSAAQVAYMNQYTVVHEIAHQFGLDHNGDTRPDFISVMWTYSNDAGEADAVNVPIRFNETEIIEKIRRIGRR